MTCLWSLPERTELGFESRPFSGHFANEEIVCERSMLCQTPDFQKLEMIGCVFL
jgi:hypothetical protein